MNKFESIAFEKLRAQFWDAAFVLVPHHSHCMGFHFNFQFDFTLETIRRAWAHLDNARRFIAKVRPEYLTGDKKLCLDRLDALVTEAYCKIALATATTDIKYKATPEVADINDEFLF